MSGETRTHTLHISGIKHTPSWELLERFLKEAGIAEGKLRRIARKDNGCNYRAPGEYRLEFVHYGKQVTTIVDCTFESEPAVNVVG